VVRKKVIPARFPASTVALKRVPKAFFLAFDFQAAP
jgi:hypothetical protein